MICPSLLKEKNIIDNVDNVEENGDCFFKILAECNFKNDLKNKVNKVKIYFDSSELVQDLGINNTDYIHNTEFKVIISKISYFAIFTNAYILKNDENNEIINNFNKKSIAKIVDPINSIKIKDNYSNLDSLIRRYSYEFDSYLCSYLLYYLAEEIAKKKINVEILNNTFNNTTERDINTIKTTNFDLNKNFFKISKEYNVDFEIMDKILDKLLKDKPLKNVEYIQDQQKRKFFRNLS